ATSSLPGRTAVAGLLISLLPRKSVIPESSLLSRLRWVSLAMFALSGVVTVTVSRSPIRAARWSLKKAREPFRHSEFALYEACSGFGIGICTGLLPGCVGGFLVAVRFGVLPAWV